MAGPAPPLPPPPPRPPVHASARPVGPAATPPPASGPAGPAHDVLGVAVEDDKWLVSLDPKVSLSTGTATKDPLRVPVADAQRLLREAAREAAGLPKGA